MTTRIAVIGESLVDVVQEGPTQERHGYVGGSPLNVAVGLARLGLPATLHTRIGRDGYGEMVAGRLADEGVAVPDGALVDDRTSTATVTLADDGGASYDFDLVWDLPVPDVSDTSGVTVVHTGSIGAVLEPGGTVARTAVATAGPGVLRTYDPNVRSDIMGDAGTARRVIRDLAASCHVVKFSDEDAAWLGDGRTADEVLADVAASGTRVTVMTRGADGCTAVVDGVTHEVPGRKVEVADTIGAGDAFMSGLLFALVSDGSDRLLVAGEPLGTDRVARALDTAVASAAVAVSRAGAQPPHRDELV
ncbi:MULTISPECIES: carbohydrate kinase family protein [unclassified Corynebacterium]|uniref:carbohydrate kinase family protein n=1 Tax=unclassified Corynebacterium TaxID=2624378 RepID=UPI0040343131